MLHILEKGYMYRSLVVMADLDQNLQSPDLLEMQMHVGDSPGDAQSDLLLYDMLAVDDSPDMWQS
jgi:hypothetical protein